MNRERNKSIISVSIPDSEFELIWSRVGPRQHESDETILLNGLRLVSEAPSRSQAEKNALTVNWLEATRCLSEETIKRIKVEIYRDDGTREKP